MPKIKIEASVDDGAIDDLRIADLMKKYEIPCIFYVPINYRKYREISNRELKELSKEFEIGGHGVEHYSLREVPEDIALSEINLSRELLRTITGQPINSFCYPRGRYNEAVKKMVVNAGYGDGRTTKVLHTEFDYDPFEKPTTLHIFPRKEYEGKDIVQVAREQAEKIKTSGGIFHTWMHGWEVEKLDLWDKLEDVLKIMAELK